MQEFSRILIFYFFYNMLFRWCLFGFIMTKIYVGCINYTKLFLFKNDLKICNSKLEWNITWKRKLELEAFIKLQQKMFLMWVWAFKQGSKHTIKINSKIQSSNLYLHVVVNSDNKINCTKNNWIYENQLYNF